MSCFRRRRPNDSTQVVADLRVREEVFVKPAPWLQFAGGRRPARELARSGRGQLARRLFGSRRAAAAAVDPAAGGDADARPVHARRRQAVHPLGQDRHRHADRSLRAARFPERRRHASFSRSRAVRGVAQAGDDTFEVVWVPRFTPSRMPLLDQRWTPVPAGRGDSRSSTRGAVAAGRLAGRRSLGATSAQAIEYSLSFFDGFNHLPAILSDVSADAAASGRDHAAVSGDPVVRRRRRGADAVVHREGGGGVLHSLVSTPARPTSTCCTWCSSSGRAASGSSSAATPAKW